MPPQSTPLFEDLLQRLASEHKREVNELRAEIARLQGGCGDGEALADQTQPKKVSSFRVSQGVPDTPLQAGAKAGHAFEEETSNDGRPELPHKSPADLREPCNGDPVKPVLVPGSVKQGDGSVRGVFIGQEPDQDALAAAYAVATQEGLDKDLLDMVEPWGDVERQGSCPENQRMDSEALSLWNQFVKHMRREVFRMELPKTHSKWTTTEQSGLNLNRLIGVKATDEEELNTDMEMVDAPSDAGIVQTMIRSMKGKRCFCLVLDLPLHPNSKTRMIWDMLGITLLVHDLIMIPMGFFQYGTTYLPAGYQKLNTYWDIMSAVFWSVDIAISFFTGYHSTAGFVEMRIQMIARHYVRTWFPVDSSIVTVDWVTLCLAIGSVSNYMRLGKTVSRVMRVARLFRFMKMSKQVSELMARINSEYILTAIGLVRLVILIVIVNHYIACFWFGIAQLPDKNEHKTWTQVHLEAKGFDDLAYCYFTCLHWSLTQFTPASMEVTPTNVYERMFNVIVIIGALVIFSSFVSSITGAMTHIRNINAQAVHRDTMIRRYFSENNISHALSVRVWHFVRQKHVAAGKRLKTKEMAFLQQLPVRIRDELFQEVHSPVLSVHPLFQWYFRVSPKAMPRICKKGLVEMSVEAGKEFKQEGECRKMIFVMSGILEFHSLDATEEDGLDFITIEQGEWAYEAVLWADKVTVDAHLIAAPGGCDLLLLDADTFRTVALENYDTFDTLVKYAGIFMQRFTSDMENEEAIRENLLFNNHNIVRELVVEATNSTEQRSLMLRKASTSLLQQFRRHSKESG